MSEMIKPFAEYCAAGVEAIGIGIIAIFSIYALLYAFSRLFKKENTEEGFHKTRQKLGRGILLGLEFLVAADIIDTVAVELTFHSVAVLSIIVLIRTFLSFTLEVELTGRWPWQQKKTDAGNKV